MQKNNQIDTTWFTDVFNYSLEKLIIFVTKVNIFVMNKIWLEVQHLEGNLINIAECQKFSLSRRDRIPEPLVS